MPDHAREEGPATIRRATSADATRLSELARRLFEQAFAHTTSAEDLSAFLDASFDAAVLRSELADPDVEILIAEQDGQWVGYVQVERVAAPASVHGPDPVMLHRIYVDRSAQGTGIAQSLLDTAHGAARHLGGRTLWLSVWQENARAIAFYRKHEFEVVGTAEFVVGTDIQADYLMAVPVRLQP
jgi:ribosomal protein S18 acetylase RimI-like enzyme